MKKILSLLCLIGGVLWGVKPLYDWLVIGREINTGYTVFDWTDYIKFAFPLLCVGGVIVLISLYKNQIKGSVIILFISLILHTLFHFSEIYLSESGIPFGLLFIFTGMLTLFIGSISLVFQLKKETVIPRILYLWAIALSVTTFLFCLLPFVSPIIHDVIETPIMVGLMMLIGFIWAGIGLSLQRIVSLKV